jgi:hypothetical protein
MGLLLPRAESVTAIGPWHIGDGTLIPLGIKYRAPGQRTRATTVSEKMESLSKEV